MGKPKKKLNQKRYDPEIEKILIEVYENGPVKLTWRNIPPDLLKELVVKTGLEKTKIQTWFYNREYRMSKKAQMLPKGSKKSKQQFSHNKAHRRGKKKRSALWNYFECVKGGQEDAICNECGKSVPRPKCSTWLMWSHLTTDHNEIYCELQVDNTSDASHSGIEDDREKATKKKQ